MSVQVGIVYGSPNDEPTMNKAVAVLERFGVSCEQESMSAHRMPGRVHEYISGAEDRGMKVIIAGAGVAAHLAGVCASLTTLPVIAVPLSGGIADGLDALLSSVQMPPGVPVATVAVNGAANAGLLAVQILALGDEGLRKKLHELKAELANGGRL
jgi:5-(carboxyamino)imidazole ribonucleotide mutase